jgi:hypothetical protein
VADSPVGSPVATPLEEPVSAAAGSLDAAPRIAAEAVDLLARLRTELDAVRLPLEIDGAART